MSWDISPKDTPPLHGRPSANAMNAKAMCWPENQHDIASI
jgi:hypothetical protein